MHAFERACVCWCVFLVCVYAQECVSNSMHVNASVWRCARECVCVCVYGARARVCVRMRVIADEWSRN